MYHFPLALQCVYGCSDDRGENGDGKDELYFWRRAESGDYLVSHMQMTRLCIKLKQVLKEMVGRFVGV